MRHRSIYIRIYHTHQIQRHNADDAQIPVSAEIIAAALERAREPLGVKVALIHCWRKEIEVAFRIGIAVDKIPIALHIILILVIVPVCGVTEIGRAHV